MGNALIVIGGCTGAALIASYAAWKTSGNLQLLCKYVAIVLIAIATDLSVSLMVSMHG